MGNLFGKKKVVESRITAQDRAVLQLKVQRDKLQQYLKRIETNLEKDRLLARKLLQDGKKDRAKLLLRKKKYQEQLLSKADSQLDNIERLTQDLEFATIEMQVVNGLKHGNEALKNINALMNIEDIERILDETREGVDKQREIDDLLTGVLSVQDEEDVEAELQGILDDQLPELPETTEVEHLPSVPSEPVEIQETRQKAKKKAVSEEPMLEA